MKMFTRVIAAAFLFALTASSQTSLASLRGLVTDAQNAIVPNAEVTAVNDATGVQTTAKTDSAGLYSITNLAIGEYTLMVKVQGFRTYRQEHITLGTGEVRGINVMLEVGSLTDSVTVTADAPLIQSRTADISQLITSNSVEDMPLGDRQTLNILKMTGAAVFASYGVSATSTPNFSLAGSRSSTQMFMIDGGSAQNMRLGLANIDEDPPVETVDEVKIMANNYTAEYGGSAGGVVIMTTKSGTNTFHGSLYEYLRNDAFDAPGFFAAVQNGQKLKPELRYNVFGGTFGGPIRHDKTFFFLALDNSLRVEGGTAVLTVPTLLQRMGDFSQTTNANGVVIPIYDPGSTVTNGSKSTRTQFNGNKIPSDRFDPVAVKLMSFYPLPNQPPINKAGASNFAANYAVGTPHYNVTAKIDHSFGDKDRLTGRYLFNHDSQDLKSYYPDKGADPTKTALDWQGIYYGAWTHLFSATQLNDFRFTWLSKVNHSMSAGLGGDYPGKLGLTGIPNNAFPQFTVNGISVIGSSSQERRQYPIRSVQWIDNYSWTHGRHAFKFGAEVRKSSDYEINLNNASGTFQFNTLPTGQPGVAASGNGIATLLLGYVTNFTQSASDIVDRHSYYLAGFAQDDWSVTSRLTLNIGLRWETDTPMVDANNHMNGFDPTAINPVSGTPGVVKFMGVNGFRTTPFDADWNNFGPRFGVAWRPFNTNNTVIRGGYGVFFSHPYDAAAPISAMLGFGLSASIGTPDNGITPAFLLKNGVPASASSSSTPLNDSFGAVPVGKNPNTAVTYFDPNHRTGYSQQFNFSIQHQLPGSVVVEASVLGNLSRKLPGTPLSLDQIAPQVLGPASNTQAFRPYPQFSDVQLLYPSIGISNYYGALIKAERRFAKGVSLLATYTHSKYLTNVGDGGSAVGSSASYSNAYNRRADYGPSGNDIEDRMTVSGIYQLPFGKGRRWLTDNPLRFVAGGWSVAGIGNLQSGPPITVNTQTNNTNAFSAGPQRADVIGDPSGPRTVAEWFNISAFAQPAALHFGNAGVGIVRGPGLINFDFSLLRDFYPIERIRLQFRGEFLNATNHTNFNPPNSSFGNANFGVISSAAPARQIQLGIRATF